MWLKNRLEKHYIHHLQEFYARTEKRFELRSGVKIFPSYKEPNTFHLLGYVQKSYNINGITYIELKASNSEPLIITTPKYTDVSSLEYQAVLCVSVEEHYNDVIDNTIFERVCTEVIVL
jgi:hypothetical protein